MSTLKSRSDELLATWTDATARPIPSFVRRPRRGRSTRIALVALAVIALATALIGVLAVGGLLRLPDDRQAPADPPTSVSEAIARAPGVRYALAVAVQYPEGTQRLNSTGEIDFQGHRFSGVADDGGAGFGMVLFGGPSSGAVIQADGLFVQTDGGPWVHVVEQHPEMAAFADALRLSNAVSALMASSSLDPTTRTAPCGAETCQVMVLTVPPAALFDLEVALLGPNVQAPAPDLGPINVELLVDPSHFPVRMQTQVKAGTTITTVTLELTRLDPAPSISAPIP